MKRAPIQQVLITRRAVLLAGTAILLSGRALAEPISGAMPWSPDAGAPPERVTPGPWLFFTAAEGRAIEAYVDRLIPADDLSPGGTDCGCAVYIDRQLAGPYGRAAALYDAAPFQPGTLAQGDQSALTPAALYRQGLQALDAHCRAAFGGRVFADLSAAQQDMVVAGIEDQSVKIVDAGPVFFEQVLTDTTQGFFADPIYGGNRDMVSWRMIGFPGARYDYRDWIGRHNEAYPYPPTSIGGAPGWRNGQGDGASQGRK